jgi:hypothetical protein
VSELMSVRMWLTLEEGVGQPAARASADWTAIENCTAPHGKTPVTPTFNVLTPAAANPPSCHTRSPHGALLRQ